MCLNDLAEEIHNWARSKGFWEHEIIWDHSGDGAVANPSIVPEKLMLIVTEVAETMEGFRDGDHENMAEELADTVIRILDLCQWLGFDIEEEIRRKMEKNRLRPRLHGRQR